MSNNKELKLYKTIEKEEQHKENNPILKKKSPEELIDFLLDKYLFLEQRQEQLEQKNNVLEQSLNQKEQEIQELKQINKMFINIVTTFREKTEVIGLIHNWYAKSSDEYKYYDQDMIRELIKKHHLNSGNETIPPHDQKNPLLQIVKYCYEAKLDTIYRNEIDRLLAVPPKTTVRIMKKIAMQDPILFQLKQKTDHTKMYYLQIVSPERLKERYHKFF